MKEDCLLAWTRFPVSKTVRVPADGRLVRAGFTAPADKIRPDATETHITAGKSRAACIRQNRMADRTRAAFQDA